MALQDPRKLLWQLAGAACGLMYGVCIRVRESSRMVLDSFVLAIVLNKGAMLTDGQCKAPHLLADLQGMLCIDQSRLGARGAWLPTASFFYMSDPFQTSKPNIRHSVQDSPQQCKDLAASFPTWSWSCQNCFVFYTYTEKSRLLSWSC